MGTRILEIEQDGSGPCPKVGDKLVVHYTGCLASDGRCFDSSRARGHALTFTVGTGRVIKGWDLLMLKARAGMRMKMFITAADAYGAKGSPVATHCTLPVRCMRVSVKLRARRSAQHAVA